MKFPHKLYAGTVVAVAMLAFFGVPAAAVADEPADASYYRMNPELETHRGNTVTFDTLRGRPALVSMFYASCPHVCPMLISTIQGVERQLPPELLEQLQVALISVDPARDTPRALKKLAEERRVDGDRWLLARTANPFDTRALAAVLGIRFKELPDGQFNHTSVVILLDEAGREVARTSKLGVPEADFVDAVRKALLVGQRD